MRLLLRSSTNLWRRDVKERVARAVLGFLKRGEFPGEETRLLLALVVYDSYAEHLGFPLAFITFFYSHG
jgi:hypothetical protein